MLARAIRPTAVIAAGAGTALYGAHIAHLQSQPIRCDAYPAALKRRPDLQATRSGQARPGPKTRAGSIVNPAILRQITSGSICGTFPCSLHGRACTRRGGGDGSAATLLDPADGNRRAGRPGTQRPVQATDSHIRGSHHGRVSMWMMVPPWPLEMLMGIT